LLRIRPPDKTPDEINVAEFSKNPDELLVTSAPDMAAPKYPEVT
jgi:hypothetical protein